MKFHPGDRVNVYSLDYGKLTGTVERVTKHRLYVRHSEAPIGEAPCMSAIVEPFHPKQCRLIKCRSTFTDR